VIISFGTAGRFAETGMADGENDYEDDVALVTSAVGTERSAMGILVTSGAFRVAGQRNRPVDHDERRMANLAECVGRAPAIFKQFDCRC
jgi:hypothetical protein